MGPRRDNPAYCSNNEAARDRKRTEAFVRSITGTDYAVIENRRYPLKVQSPRVYSKNDKVRGSTHRTYSRKTNSNYYVKYTKIIGETDNFVVQFSYERRLIEIYGKDFFYGQHFKLMFSKDESQTIINFLARARNILGNQQVTKIGETNKFVVDSDGDQRLVLLYEKTTQELPTKLGFNENETTAVIDLLVKARSFFK